jgi:hypothetical protein
MGHERDYKNWAKKFDSEKHITHHNSIGGGVLCGKYGALLGNNYATMNMPICPECKRVEQLVKQVKPT